MRKRAESNAATGCPADRQPGGRAHGIAAHPGGPTVELRDWALSRVRQSDLAALRFQLLEVCLIGKAGTRGSGEVLWVARGVASGQWIGVAWAWSVIAPCMLVVSDAMAITTNALVSDEQDHILTGAQNTSLAMLVHQMGWQPRVWRCIRKFLQ